VLLLSQPEIHTMRAYYSTEMDTTLKKCSSM
jgi:hypothetical protein